MTSKFYRHTALVLLLLCIVTSPTESRYRDKDPKKAKSAQLNVIGGHSSSASSNTLHGMSSPPLMNLCSGDREMKLVCHCSPDDEHVKAQKANCWIFSKDLPRKDPNWLAFQTQTMLEQLKITVQKIGNLTYIPSDVIVTLKNLKMLTIEYGQIPDLLNYAFGNMTDLRNITLHKNQIRIVHPFAFANHPFLEEINLERNELIELDKEALINLPQLKKLNLDFNNLTMLHDDVFVDLTNLDELKLESNQVSVLTREIFKGLGNLRLLNMKSNSISYIGDTVFAELWSLQELDLSSNHIEVGFLAPVCNHHVQQLLPLMDNLVNSTVELLLKENKLICDCRLAWLFDLANTTKNDDLRHTLRQLECLYELKADNRGAGPIPISVQHQLSDLSRPHDILGYDDSTDYGGLDHLDHGQSQHGVGYGVQPVHRPDPYAPKAPLNAAGQQVFTLMKLRKQDLLPCTKELDEPTELPLSRESIGIDMGWRSSVGGVASSSAGRLRSWGSQGLVVLLLVVTVSALVKC
ncbi:hypothetical protein pipiens_011202 [Culex pipiens pipiens]|uniref:Connectin n=1 Tax=Culex pipiens pipiens TaxID=38569 RepID=A0ABD1D782_CULPP